MKPFVRACARSTTTTTHRRRPTRSMRRRSPTPSRLLRRSRDASFAGVEIDSNFTRDVETNAKDAEKSAENAKEPLAIPHYTYCKNALNGRTERKIDQGLLFDLVGFR